MFIKNLKILILLSLGFLVVALGMYFDDKSDSTNSTSEVLFPSFGDVLPNIAYIEFSNQTGKSVIENIDHNHFVLEILINFHRSRSIQLKFFYKCLFPH